MHMAEQGQRIEPLRASGAQRGLEAGSPNREEYAMPTTIREFGLTTLALVILTVALYVSMTAP
jgi:hypothetical protein